MQTLGVNPEASPCHERPWNHRPRARSHHARRLTRAVSPTSPPSHAAWTDTRPRVHGTTRLPCLAHRARALWGADSLHRHHPITATGLIRGAACSPCTPCTRGQEGARRVPGASGDTHAQPPPPSGSLAAHANAPRLFAQPAQVGLRPFERSSA